MLQCSCAPQGLPVHLIEKRCDVAAAKAETSRRRELVDGGEDPRARLPACPEQRPAFLQRKAVTVRHDEIDIGRTFRNVFIKEQSRLVDDRRQRPPLDLLRGERTTCEPLRGGNGLDDGASLGIGNAATGTFGIAIPAGACFPAKSPFLAQSVENFWIPPFRIAVGRKPLVW